MGGMKGSESADIVEVVVVVVVNEETQVVVSGEGREDKLSKSSLALSS